MNLERPNQDNERTEQYEDNRELSGKSLEEMIDADKKEYNYENELSKQTIKDGVDIERLTSEASEEANNQPNAEAKIKEIVDNLPDGSEPWVDERTTEEKQTPPEENKKGDMKKVGGFKKLAMSLGFVFAGLTGQAAGSNERNTADSTNKEKITQIENHKEVAGITLEGMISVPMADTTADYYFLGFSGNEKDVNKIERMKEAAKKLGFELGSDDELRDALKKHGDKLIKATGGYGISLKDVSSKVDDTKSSIIRNTVTGPQTHVLTTFNPLGKTGQYELEAIEKTGFDYNQYPVLVKKNKVEQDTVNYLDHVKN